MSEALLDLGIREIGAGYRRHKWSPREVTAAALERTAATDPIVRAWVEVDADGALAAAARAEDELQRGVDLGPLHGIPLGVKDIFDVAGFPTRCGSAALRDAAPAEQDATTVASLRRGGAVLLGKTATQEFAAGVITAPARNPWDPERIPGGSSGGSAAAVALRQCFGAMGSDTGGSIRIPAAACGVAGFKPTFGQLDLDGVYPLSWSLDTAGPIARSVDDAWLMWQALARDANLAVDALSGEASDLREARIGIPREFFFDWLQPDVLKGVEGTIDRLRQLGAEVVETPWDLASAARASAFIINRVETATVHERVATEQPDRFALYGQDLRLRVAAGRTTPATQYIEALRARELVKDSMSRLFAEHRLDALIAPTLPTTAVLAEHPIIEGTGLDESIGAGWTRLTMPFNATGQPVLSVPCGHDRAGLPIGVQLAGEPGREASLFRIGAALESALGIKDIRPSLAVGRAAVGVEARS